MPSFSRALVSVPPIIRKHLIDCLGHDAFADVPWTNQLVDFVKDVLASNRVRTFGVCFGHQIVARALGQRVDRGEGGWEISQVPLRLSEKGKEIFKVSQMVGLASQSPMCCLLIFRIESVPDAQGHCVWLPPRHRRAW